MEDLLLIPLENKIKINHFTDRYFKKFYIKETNNYFFYHSNGIMVMGLTKEHPIIKNDLKIKKMFLLKKEYNSYSVNCKDIVKGKKKKGTLRLFKDTKILVVYTECNQKFKIKANFNGYIIEINDKIIKDYNYLKKDPENSSYICIILPFKDFNPNNLIN